MPNSSKNAAGWHFGQRLRAIRKGRGLSLRELARRMQVRHPEIARWQRQSHAPKQQTLERLAEALDCHLSDLLPAGNHNPTAQPNQAVTGRLHAGNPNPTAPGAKRADEVRVLQARTTAPSEQLELVKADRQDLRRIIVELFEAQKNSQDGQRLQRAWQRLCEAAQAIPLKEMSEAVESIGALEQ